MFLECHKRDESRFGLNFCCFGWIEVCQHAFISERFEICCRRRLRCCCCLSTHFARSFYKHYLNAVWWSLVLNFLVTLLWLIAKNKTILFILVIAEFVRCEFLWNFPVFFFFLCVLPLFLTFFSAFMSRWCIGHHSKFRQREKKTVYYCDFV